MELSVWFLAAVVVVFSFTYAAFDIEKNQMLKQDTFQTVRAANQDALLDLENQYDENQDLTEEEMLTAWLTDFVEKSELNYADITLSFEQLETDPPSFVVTIEGHPDAGYLIMNKDAVVRYRSSATLITSDEEEGD